MHNIKLEEIEKVFEELQKNNNSSEFILEIIFVNLPLKCSQDVHTSSCPFKGHYVLLLSLIVCLLFFAQFNYN